MKKKTMKRTYIDIGNTMQISFVSCIDLMNIWSAHMFYSCLHLVLRLIACWKNWKNTLFFNCKKGWLSIISVGPSAYFTPFYLHNIYKAAQLEFEMCHWQEFHAIKIGALLLCRWMLFICVTASMMFELYFWHVKFTCSWIQLILSHSRNPQNFNSLIPPAVSRHWHKSITRKQ